MTYRATAVPKVNPTEDPCVDTLVQCGLKIREEAHHPRQSVGIHIERRCLPKEVGEYASSTGGCAAQAGRVIRIGRRGQKRRPRQVGNCRDIAIGIRKLNRSDRPPEVVVALSIPNRDTRVGDRYVEQGQEASVFGEIGVTFSRQPDSDSIPEVVWPICGWPETCDVRLRLSPSDAVQTADTLHFIEVCSVQGTR
jgi:hypothetical protein